MSIYTGFGDAGQTKLLAGAVTWKDDPRVSVYGTLDEATSALGMARATTSYDDICRDIIGLQSELINVMTELATPPQANPVVKPVDSTDVKRLEGKVDGYEKERVATHKFTLPGWSQASAAIDLARTIVRRAERSLVTLGRQEKVNPDLLRYLNRLSDLLYVMARVEEQREIKKLIAKTLQTPEKTGCTSCKLNLEVRDRLVKAGICRAQQIGVPMVLALADEGGNLVEMRCMDGALPVSVGLAPNKACTAASVRMPTHELGRLAQPGAPLYGIETNTPNLTLVGGGFPLVVNGAVIGAVGVSGGSVEQDMEVAQAMVAALAEID